MWFRTEQEAMYVNSFSRTQSHEKSINLLGAWKLVKRPRYRISRKEEGVGGTREWRKWKNKKNCWRVWSRKSFLFFADSCACTCLSLSLCSFHTYTGSSLPFLIPLGEFTPSIAGATKVYRTFIVEDVDEEKGRKKEREKVNSVGRGYRKSEEAWREGTVTESVVGGKNGVCVAGTSARFRIPCIRIVFSSFTLLLSFSLFYYFFLLRTFNITIHSLQSFSGLDVSYTRKLQAKCNTVW